MDVFKKLLNAKQTTEIPVVGMEGQPAVPAAKRSASSYFYFATLCLLLIAIAFAYLTTANLIDSKEFALRNYHEALEKKKTAQNDLEALQVLSAQADSIREDQVLIEQAVPPTPRYDQMVSYIDSIVNDIRRQQYMEVPETISWDVVSPADVSNGALQALEIYEYNVPFSGTYEALLDVVDAFRTGLRIVDVRAIRGIKIGEEGNVEADLLLWAYNLYPSF